MCSFVSHPQPVIKPVVYPDVVSLQRMYLWEQLQIASMRTLKQYLLTGRTNKVNLELCKIPLVPARRHKPNVTCTFQTSSSPLSPSIISYTYLQHATCYVTNLQVRHVPPQAFLDTSLVSFLSCLPLVLTSFHSTIYAQLVSITLVLPQAFP